MESAWLTPHGETELPSKVGRAILASSGGKVERVKNNAI
jgi:hypothetical protein